MVFPFNFYRGTNQENLNPNIEQIDNELTDLSKKILSEVLVPETSITDLDIDAFLAELEATSALNSPSDDSFNQHLNDLPETFYSSSPELTLPLSSATQTPEFQQMAKQTLEEYIAFLRNIKPKFFKEELLSLVRKNSLCLINSIKVEFGKKHCKKFVRLMKVLLNGFLLFLLIKLAIITYGIVSPVLKAVFQSLRDKVLSKKSNSKRQSTTEENKREKNGESKKLWDKPLELVSKVLKINRGGNLVPLSELEGQQALKMLEMEYQKSHTQGKLSRWKLKFKKFIRLQASRIIYKALAIFLGTLLFMDGVNNGTIISPQNRNLPNIERVVPGQRFVTLDLLRFAPPIDEPNVNGEKMIMSIQTPTKINKPLKTTESISSRVKSVNRTRKRAKVVHLSDLPPLVDQYSDQDIDVTLSSTPTDIKIKIR